MTASRRNRIVLEAVDTLLQEDAALRDQGLTPAEVGALLRERGQPLAPWEIRFELSALEASGELDCDPATGRWQRDEERRRSA